MENQQLDGRLEDEYFDPDADTAELKAFKLTKADYDRWWASIPRTDQEAFVLLYKGDIVLARYVCAIWTYEQHGKVRDGWMIIHSYALAAGIDPDTEECAVRAKRAFGHEAVRYLLDRLMYRAKAQGQARLMNKAIYLSEQLLEEASRTMEVVGPDGMKLEVGILKPKDRAAYLQAATTLIRTIQKEEILERILTHKDALKNVTPASKDGKDPLDTGEKTVSLDSISPEEARLHIIALTAKFGVDVLK